MNTESSLVFFDTFSHESSASQLDLVQFQLPVQVNEIRVIPLGARVQADFPGGVRLGATNPSQFEIEFFVNDLSKRGAATFESIGCMQYSQHGDIKMDLGKKLPTDGLLLRGKYNTITLAVYGKLAKVYQDSPPKSQSDPPQPPPEKVNTHERIRDWLEDTKVPRSPDRPWDESAEGKSEKEKRKEKQSGLRELDKLKASHERSSHSREKSWDLSEKSYRKGSKESTSKGIEGELSKDRDMVTKIKDVELTDNDRHSCDREWESEVGRGKDIDYDRDGISGREIYEEEFGLPKKRKNVDEWEHRSETSSHSMRRPRTPQEMEKTLSDPRIARSPYPCGDDVLRKEWDDKDWDRDSRGKESFRNWSRSRSRDKDRGRSPLKSLDPSNLPPPILSDEMEAISDDEEILNLPVEVAEGEYPAEENIDGSINDENEAFEYEDIMSDEEELSGYQSDEEYIVEEWEDYLKTVSNQELLDIQEMHHFHPPSFTEYEAELFSWNAHKEREKFSGERDTVVINGQTVDDPSGGLPLAEESNKINLLSHGKLPKVNQDSALKSQNDQLLTPTEKVFNQALKLRNLTKETSFPSRLGEEMKDLDAVGDISVVEEEEMWVQAVEYASQLLPEALVCVDNKQEVLEILYSWVENGLNYDMAMNQQQPLYKIRHMKAGIKLAVSLLQCKENVAVDLLNQGIFDKLIDLFGKEYMAVSIKLLMLRAIDTIAINLEGIRYMTNITNGISRYERMLKLFSSSQQSRVKVSISAILRKIHFYEVCEKFHDDVKKLAISLQSQCGLEEDEITTDFQNLDKFDDSTLALLISIESCLKEIVRCYVFADHLMTQSIRWLPGSKPFQLPKSDYDPFSPIYRMLNETKMMEAISVLLASSQLINNAPILKLIKIFLEHLVGVEHGIIYLAWKGTTTTNIIKSLLQFEKDDRDYGCESLFQRLGWKIAYSVYLAKIFDNLAQIADSAALNTCQQEAKLSDASLDQACSQLNALESLMLSSVGKEMLIHTMTLPSFAQTVFPYLKIHPTCNLEEQPTVWACFDYAVELLVTSIKLNPKASFLEACSGPLTELIDKKLSAVRVEDCMKLLTLQPYLSVSKPENFTYDNLPALITAVQEGIEKLEQFPGELFTALQIICYLTIPSRSLSDFDADHCTDEMVEELRFKYATIQLFSGELHTYLIHLLSKLCSMYGQTLQNKSNFTTAQGKLVLLLIRPSVLLLKNLLGSVIEARNTDFKDLTVIVPLLNSYLLLDMFPNSSPYFSEARSTKGIIISILLLFTQPVYTTEGEQVLAKSLWTLMMTEIFRMLLSSPKNVVGIIKLLIKLLPLPLPIQSYYKLTDEETLQAVRLRKLWSAHLYILSGTLHDIIVRLGVGAHPTLTHSLRKMSVAIADLSAPMALLVARSTLDLVIQSHRLDQKNTPRDGHQTMSAQTRRVLGTLSSLMSHAPLKTAFVHLLRGGGLSLTATKSKTEEKYPTLISIWCELLNAPSNVQIHLAAQNSLLVVVYNLFDQEITMRQISIPSFAELSGLPPKDLLVPLLEAVVDSLRTCMSVNFAFRALCILLLLLNHNYGFYFVKCTLDKKKGSLLPVLKMICCQMKKNFPEYFQLLHCVITFCCEMLQPREGRKYIAMPSDMASYIGWKAGLEEHLSTFMATDVQLMPENFSVNALNEESKQQFYMNRLEQFLVKLEDIHLKNVHPLLQLEKLVVENGPEDDLSEFMYEDIKYLICCMEFESTNSESPILECVEHTIQPLQAQFASRITWVIPTDDEDQSKWFLPPVIDNIDQSDMIKVNLLEICRKYTEDYDLAGAVHKVSKGLSFQSLSPQKLSKAVPKYKQSSSAIRPDRKGKPYVAPMRGRNYGRGNIRSDPFRSRPPNTSRPPSLHVDDFVALESTGHQPTGPTGYNKISFGRGKMMLESMRGRGRQRGMNESRGNRFFHRTPFRAMRSRSQGWGYRGGGRGNYRGASGGSGHFMRGRAPSGTYRGRGMSGITKERFSMKYVDRGRRKYS